MNWYDFLILWTTVTCGGTMKRNLTVQLDDEVIGHAKVLAARRGTSVSSLVAATLERLVADDERYQEARDRAGRALRQAGPRGGRTWQRAELHDR